jgi:pyrophosphate--fructose-6-phosphate 1-phosphotransferase
MVQKSGYFARSAAANGDDLRLIQGMVDLAVESALNKVSGVTGHDEGQGGKLRTIEFPRIKGGKPFDMSAKWFIDMMDSIGQPHRAA